MDPSQPLPELLHEQLCQRIALSGDKVAAWRDVMNPRISRRSAIESVSRVMGRAGYRERLQWLIRRRIEQERQEAALVGSAGAAGTAGRKAAAGVSGAAGAGVGGVELPGEGPLARRDVERLLEAKLRTGDLPASEFNRAVSAYMRLRDWDGEGEAQTPDPAFVVEYFRAAEAQGLDIVAEAAPEAAAAGGMDPTDLAREE